MTNEEIAQWEADRKDEFMGIVDKEPVYRAYVKKNKNKALTERRDWTGDQPSMYHPSDYSSNIARDWGN